jgi:hypothetical protein
LCAGSSWSRRQVLVVGDQPAVRSNTLPNCGCIFGIVQAGEPWLPTMSSTTSASLRLHGAAAKSGEIQAGARQVFVELVEVDAPVAVVAGLAAVGEDAAALPSSPPVKASSGLSTIGVIQTEVKPRSRM